MSSRYKIFTEVCSTGSFSKTAENIGYSQSAVSQAVKSLEEELGTVLLERKREGIILTEDGSSYLPYIRAIAAAEDALGAKRNEMHGLVNAKIRIGAFTSVSRNLLPAVIADFRKKYPRTQFELRQGEYDEIYSWLKNHEVDFGFINPHGYKDIYTEVIYQDSMMAVLPANHPLCRKKEVSLRDLCADPFILLDEGRYSVPMEAFAREGLKPDLAYKVYDDYSILAMVRQNMGISILYGLVTAGFDWGVEIRPIREPVERDIAIACMNPQVVSGASRLFMEYVRKKVPAVLEELGIYEK